MPRPDWTTATWFAAVAFIISLANLWWGVLRPWWLNRAAIFEVRLERVHLPPAVSIDVRVDLEKRTSWQPRKPQQVTNTRHRIAVLNRGPSSGRKITMTIWDRDGTRIDLLAPDLRQALKIPVLQAGQTYFVEQFAVLGALPPDYVDLSWSDGRPRQKRLRYYVTEHDVL